MSKFGSPMPSKLAALNKLCTENPTNKEILCQELYTYTVAEINAFLEDLVSNLSNNDALGNHVGNLTPTILTTWHYLYTKHATNAENARKDWNTLVQFGKLNDNVKEYIVKFSDASATNSSLIKFCADLPKPLGGGSDVKFIDYVNIEENLNVVKNFVGHKLNDTAFDPVYEETGEEETDNSLVGLAQDWVKRSDAWRKTQGYMQDGRDYGNHAAKNLLSPNSSLATSLSIDMSEYYLFREVELYVDKAENQYTKADILLVKYDGQRIDNVILLETKISGSTEYTPRQKQSYRIIERGGVDKIGVFELKSSKPNSTLINGTIRSNGPKLLSTVDNNTNIISISKSKSLKVSDHGLKNGVLEVSPIPTVKYINYVAPDNK